jgi:glycosyltransferase involved in cell wall biosynthesis
MNEPGDMRLKVLFAVPSLAGGGAERVVTVLLRHLDRERFEPSLVLAAGSGPLRSHVPDDVVVEELDSARVRSSARGLVSAIRRKRPDVVFSTLGHMNMLIRLARPFMPKGTAFVARENNIPSINLRASSRPGLWRFLYRRLYPGFERVVCQSGDMLEDMVGNFGAPRDKCTVIPNPVDVDRVRELAASGEPDFAPEGVNLLACGRLRDQKGFDLLITAMAELDDTVALTVLGDGPLRRGLELLTEEEGVAHKVRFQGFSDNPYPDMAACAAFVLSSRYEGFPNVVLEALALGSKVAAFDCPGDVDDILKGLPGCALARPEDPSDLARAITEALEAQSDPEALTRSVRERFGADTITRRYEAVFEEAVRSVR